MHISFRIPTLLAVCNLKLFEILIIGRSGQCMAEPPSVCARRSEAVPEALGRLGMRAGGSGPHRSGQAALAGRARHTPAWLPMEPSGGWVAGSLCHDSAGAAARGLAVGGTPHHLSRPKEL